VTQIEARGFKGIKYYPRISLKELRKYTNSGLIQPIQSPKFEIRASRIRSKLADHCAALY
jgi:hypothetical protein